MPSHCCKTFTICSLPFVIDEPGVYCVKKDLDFTPPVPAAGVYDTAAITIKASNVVLDLCDHTLKLTNNVIRVGGIRVDRDVQNITIRNGTVRDFSGALGTGIRVLGNVSTVLLEDLLLTNNGFKSITLISDGVQGGVVLGETSAVALAPAGGDGTKKLSNVTVRRVRCIDNGAHGMYVFNLFNLYISDSQFNENKSLNAAGTRLCAGLRIGGSLIGTSTITPFVLTNLTIKNCNFDKNFSVAGSTLGMALAHTLNVLIENSTFNDNEYTGVVTNTEVRGALVEQSKYITIRNCQFNKNMTNGGRSVGGISISGVNTTIPNLIGEDGLVMENCWACGNLMLNPGSGSAGQSTVHGIYSSYSRGLVFKNCVANYNRVISGASLTAVNAIGIAVIQRSGFDQGSFNPYEPLALAPVIENCTACYNTVDNLAVLRDVSGGFQINFQFGLVKNCNSLGNSMHGFAVVTLNESGTPVLNEKNVFEGCISNSNGRSGFHVNVDDTTILNRYGPVTFTKCIANYNIAHGFVFAGRTGATGSAGSKATFLDNLASENGGIGFWDLNTNLSSSLLARNTARQNAVGNYNVTYSSGTLQVVTGNVSNVVPLSVNSWDNVSIN